MGKFEDLTGQKFGRLTVIKRAPDYISPKGYKITQWSCKCDCEEQNEVIASTHSLKSEHTKSCGCLRNEKTIERSTKHGQCGTRLYGIWRTMHSRCENPNVSVYHVYGAEGKTVCEEWRDFEPFYQWAIANGYDKNAKREKCTLERRDGTKGYSPDNCYWADMTTQNNNRRNNHLITFNNKTQSLAQWSKELNISRAVLSTRLNELNWDIEKALTTPVKQRKRQGA